MAEDVRDKVLDAFVVNLGKSDALSPEVISALRKLFESGERVSADQVTSILTESADDDGGDAE